MSTFLYNNFLLDTVNGAVTPGSASYAVMLVTDSYVPNKQTDHFRSDVLLQAGAEVAASGYTAGGTGVSMTEALNSTLNQLTLTFSSPNWASSSITARGAVIYVSRGGAPSADNLAVYVDFGMDVTSTNGTFTAIFSTPLTFQN